MACRTRLFSWTRQLLIRALLLFSINGFLLCENKKNINRDIGLIIIAYNFKSVIMNDGILKNIYFIIISNTLPFWKGFYPLESFDFLVRNPPYYYFVYYFGMYCTSDRFGDKIQQVAGQWCDCSIYTSWHVYSRRCEAISYLFPTVRFLHKQPIDVRPFPDATVA